VCVCVCMYVCAYLICLCACVCMKLYYVCSLCMHAVFIHKVYLIFHRTFNLHSLSFFSFDQLLRFSVFCYILKTFPGIVTLTSNNVTAKYTTNFQYNVSKSNTHMWCTENNIYIHFQLIFLSLRREQIRFKCFLWKRSILFSYLCVCVCVCVCTCACLFLSLLVCMFVTRVKPKIAV
jgi:hypothetical protein